MLSRRSMSLLGSVRPFQYSGTLRSSCVISEGFKRRFMSPHLFKQSTHEPDAEYWLDLGQSSVFEDKILIECINRIHDDVLKVWNFNDPTKVSFIRFLLSSGYGFETKVYPATLG